MDYLTKLFKYRTAGVREYWIVNPMQETVQVYYFGDQGDSVQYAFIDLIESKVLKGLNICLAELLQM